MSSPTSLYIHIPFCRRRCGYCNFALVANRDHLIDGFLRALEVEISRTAGGPIKTIFIGGGTPTHLSIEQLESLFKLVENHFEIAADCEFSMEGNPADINRELAGFLREKNVNRISLGVQSFHDAKLEFLERDHDRESVFQASEIIRREFDDFSIDLIFGAQGESAESWKLDLQDAMACAPTHISTYSLTIEKGTQFWNRQNRSQAMQVDDDLSVDLYDCGVDVLNSMGYRHYEISNFAQTGFECRHNINYWQGGEFYGLGPGAARYLAGVRATNHASTSRYIQLLLNGDDPTVEADVLDPEQRAREKLIFGLRQIAGIGLDDFRNDTGYEVMELVGKSLNRFLDQGLLQLDGSQLKLTRQGLLVSDSLWPDFL